MKILLRILRNGKKKDKGINLFQIKGVGIVHDLSLDDAALKKNINLW